MITTKNKTFSTNLDYPIGAKIFGKCVKNLAFNQIIPDNKTTLPTSTSIVPTSNMCGSWIMVLAPMVGHKVHAKITTTDPKLRLCWYKTSNTAYDFITGEALDTTSTESNVFEGIYEITQDMVYSDNYLQLYYWVYAGLQTGSHTITVQLTDLTAMGWHDITLDQFHALFPQEMYSNMPITYQTISSLEKVQVKNNNVAISNLSLPLYAVPDESKKICLNQLVNSNTITLTNGRKYLTIINGVKSIQTGTGNTLSVDSTKDEVIDLTLMYGAGNEPTEIEDIPSSILDSYIPYNTGSFDYLSLKVRDIWENTVQNKKVRVADLSSLNWTYDSDLQAFYTNGLFSLIKAPTSADDSVNAICGRYNTVAYNNMADKTISCTNTGFLYIKDSAYNDPALLKADLEGEMFYYELLTPSETTTTTLLLGNVGDNKVFFLDQNDNELTTDIEISYNKLISKKGNKYIEWLKNKSVKKVYKRELPIGYTKLKYIESSGEQYIDTDIIPNINHNFSIKYELTTLIPNSIIFGTRSSGTYLTSRNQIYFNIHSEGVNKYTKLFNAYGTNDLDISEVPTVNKIVEKNHIINDNLVLENPSQPYYLFTLNNLGSPTANAITKLYYFKIYERDIIVRDLIPAKRDSDGEIGMYDLVSQTFFTNQGTGEFVAGAEIQPKLVYERPSLPTNIEELESIESTGTQWIDTEIVPNDKSSFEVSFQSKRKSTSGDAICGMFYGTNNRFQIIYDNTNSFVFGIGKSNGYNTYDMNKHIGYLSAKNMIAKLDNNDIIADYSLPSSSASIYLFNSHRADALSPKAINLHIFYFKYFSDDILANYLIPIQRGTDVGMLDLVEGKIYLNEGTGSFVAHPFDENA